MTPTTLLTDVIRELCMALSICYFYSEVDRAVARQRLATINNPVTIVSSADVVTIRDTNDNHDSKVAYNLAKKLKKVKNSLKSSIKILMR